MFVKEPLDESAFKTGTETAVNRETISGNLCAAFEVKNAKTFTEGLVVNWGEIAVLRVIVKWKRTILFDDVIARILAFWRTWSDVRNVHEHFGLLEGEILELLVEFVDLVSEIAHGLYGFIGVFAFLLEFTNLFGFRIAFAFETFHFGEKRTAFVVDSQNVLQAHGRVFLFGFSNVVFRIFTDFLDVKHFMPRIKILRE